MATKRRKKTNVRFVDRFGRIHSGRIVMRSSLPGHWVLNLGGNHGTPALVHEGDILPCDRPA